jgi:PPP family 3-phenylpropionic acid transporter
MIVAPYWLTALAAYALPREDAAPPPRRRFADVGRLLGDRALIGVFLASALVQASHGLLYGFATLQWRADGIDGVTISALWAIGVVAEIALFAVSGRLSLDARTWLALGAGGAVLRWGLMALDPPGLLLPVLQILHALSFGATYLGAVQFVGRAAPSGLAATAQGLLAMANGIAMSATMAVSGLFVPLGAAGYVLMAGAAMCGGLALLMARPSRSDAAVSP